MTKHEIEIPFFIKAENSTLFDSFVSSLSQLFEDGDLDYTVAPEEEFGNEEAWAVVHWEDQEVSFEEDLMVVEL